MSKDKSEQGGSILRTIFSKLTGGAGDAKDRVNIGGKEGADEERRIFEEYDEIRQNPDEMTGWDFDRAFDFLEKHPESMFAEKLKTEMYGTNGNALKGLSYTAAVKVLQRMPDHPGFDSIMKGLNKLEADYIGTLRSDVIAYIIEILPEHPLNKELTTALAGKNLTNAYSFIEGNPDHACTPMIIQAMFDRDANIATLLLHERMDHPRVAAIFEGIYSIKKEAVKGLMPDAIMFIMDVASDHQLAPEMCRTLVEKNYIKAFDYIKTNTDHPHAEMIGKLIGEEHPDIEKLLA